MSNVLENWQKAQVILPWKRVSTKFGPSLKFESMNHLSWFKSYSLLSHFLPIHHGFDIKIIHQRLQSTYSHASRYHHCRYCNVDFTLFYNVIWYINSLVTHIQINNTNFLNVTCTLIGHMCDIRKGRVYTY